MGKTKKRGGVGNTGKSPTNIGSHSKRNFTAAVAARTAELRKGMSASAPPSAPSSAPASAPSSAPSSAPASAPPSEPPSRSQTPPPPPPAAVFAGPPPPPAATKEEQRQAKLARLQGRFRTKGGPENEESSVFGGRSRRRRRSRKTKRKTRRHRK